MLEVKNLVDDYPIRRNGRRTHLRAVDQLNLQIEAGETLGLVGESGSGKSTTALGILRLTRVTAGSLALDGRDYTEARGRQLRELRRSMQMVFQDPYSSLDPSMTIGSTLTEPLRVHHLGDRAARAERARHTLREVGLDPEVVERYPHEFSGGQRQRIAIARALVTDPSLLVCDEPVSALDVSTQGQVINLLADMRARNRMSMLFIAHDLAVVRHISDRIAVMYLSQIIETGPSERIWNAPGHPYTSALMAAIPKMGSPRRSALLPRGELPSPVHPPTGCRFHTRCPYTMAICRTTTPPEVPQIGGGTARCHLHTTGPKLEGRSVLELADRPPEPADHMPALTTDTNDS